MSQVTELLIRIKQQGDQQLTRLQGNLRNLAQQTSATNVNFKELSAELKQIQQTSVNSINNLRGYANTWREIANSVKIGSAEFKQATAEAAKLDAQLQKTQGGPGRLSGLAKGAGTIAAAGVFGGPLGAAGALAGAPFGVAGMAAGGAIAAQVGMVQQQISGLASYNAEIEKQRLALQLVTKDANSYQQGLAFINQTSRQLAIPQELITRQFTQLSASVIGAGGNVRDAEKTFLAFASGIRGTGGSLQDMEGALRAVSQVFSKGKVSAEEIRQQIGERLPGAFTLFAKSLKMTPQELDKALEEGKVSLQQFMQFVNTLLVEYEKNAQIIGKAPQTAGDRLQAALSRLSESVGRLLAPIGAAFQSIFADIVDAIDRGARALARFMGMKFFDQARIDELTKDIATLNKELLTTDARGKSFRENLIKIKQKEIASIQALAPKTKGGALPPSNLPGITDQGGGGSAESILNKLQSDFSRSVGVLGRQFNNQARRALLNDILVYEEKIGQALKKGNIGEADRLKIMQQRRALEITRDVLINEENALEDKIFEGKKKGLDVTGAQIRLDAIRLEREQAIADIKKLDNDQTREAALLVLRMTEDMARYGKDGVEPVSVFGKIKEEIQALGNSFQDIQPRLIALSDGLATSFSNAFSSLIFSAQSANQTLAQLFENIAKSFQNMIIQMINDYLKLQILTFFKNIFAPSPISVAGNFFGGGAASMFTNPSFGIGGAGLTGPVSPFAMGGIMTGSGPLKLRRYAAGGIANSPQLAMFGEGRQPEAYVPLPDGRSIPVTMQGGGQGVNVVVNVDAAGSAVQGDGPNAKALGVAISSAVKAEILKQQRPGGYLAGTR
jgi:tape measure domain-containing protein